MIKCYCGHYYDMKGDEARWCSRDTLHAVAECVGGRDMHDRLRTRLAESEHGHSIALHEIDRLMKERDAAEAEVGRLTEQDGAMLRNTMEALHAAEAERDDLLGALREMVDDLGYPDGPDEPEPVVLSRARAAIAKVGGPARPEVERGKCGECGTGREGTNG